MNSIMKLQLAVCCIALLLVQPAHAIEADPFTAVKGIWMTEDKDGAVELYSCGNELCGKFHWLKPEPGAVSSDSRDDNNPDPKLRNRPLCGMQFMGGFKPDETGEFTGGWIYSPQHGAKFSSEIRTSGKEAIELRGYVLLPILGESQIWTKTDKVTPCEPPHDVVNRNDASGKS